MAEYVYKTPDALDPQQTLLYKIAYNTASGAGSEGLTDAELRASPVPVTNSTTYTPTFVSVSSSASSTIPATAKSWSFVLLTGTGSIGGVSIPTTMLGIPISGSALAGTLAYTTGTTSSAFLAYEV